MMIIHWKSLITGAFGHGPPLDTKTALITIKEVNIRWAGQLKHWGEIV